MDPQRFDILARALTDTRSRRGALAALLGGALGSLLGRTDAGAAITRGRPKPGKNKKKPSRRPRPRKKPGKKPSPPRPAPPPPPCIAPSSCASDADCCGTDSCSCGEPHVCVQAGSLGTGACCKRHEECLQTSGLQCVVTTSGAHGVCCNPDFPESCVCQNCSECPPAQPERCGASCFATCPEGSARNPERCGCCLTEDQAWTPETCCSGQVVNGDCRGLGGNEACIFDAQCLTNSCGPGGCGSP